MSLLSYHGEEEGGRKKEEKEKGERRRKEERDRRRRRTGLVHTSYERGKEKEGKSVVHTYHHHNHYHHHHQRLSRQKLRLSSLAPHTISLD